MDLKDLAINAELGSPAAQFALGMAYYNGEGTVPNYTEAFKWLTQAAEQDYAEAQHNLAVMYEKGLGCNQDFLKAAELYARASVQKTDVEAKQDLGAVYMADDIPEPAPEEEFALWLRKAQDGTAEAQFQVAQRYDEGRGIGRDYAEAAVWYKKAAQQDHVLSQYRLGLMYIDGHGFEADYHKALPWFELAARQKHADAQYHMGLFCEQGLGTAQDHATAATWYAKAADQDHAFARHNLGFLHLLGRGVERDCHKAFTLFEAAATCGQTTESAAFKPVLAFMYLHGLGCAKNYVKALELYREAPADNVNAHAGMGYLYYRGYGLPENFAKAMEHLTYAANNGHPTAQHNLGCMYLKGTGTDKNPHAAFKWFSRAAANGEKSARYQLSRMYSNGLGVNKNKVRAYQWLITANTRFGYDDTEESFYSYAKVIMPPALTSLGYGIVSPCGKIMPDIGNSITDTPETDNVNIAVKALLALKARFLRWRLKRSLSAYDILQAQRLAAEYWEQPECRIRPSVYSVTRIAAHTDKTTDDVNPDTETAFIETIPETAATDTTVSPENTDSIKLKYN